MKIRKSLFGSPLENSPLFFWAVFILLTTSNILLSDTNYPASTKLWVLLLGLFVPLFAWARFQKGPLEKTPFFQGEFLSEFPGWVWILLGLAGIFLRFWKIDSLFLWPLGDEGILGMKGVELSQKWEWNYFNTAGQAPPPLVWIYGLLFKFSHVVFMNLWGPPAFLSFLSIATSYMAARRFFSKSFSFLCAGLMAFTYWPLYLGRLASPGVFVLFWWPFVLYCLGKYLQAQPRLKPRWALGLGIANGMNSLTFTSWPFFAGAVGLTVLFADGSRREEKPKNIFLFCAGFFAGLSPFLWAFSQSGFGQHISDVALWNGPLNGFRQAEVVWNYLSVLGWGAIGGDGYFAPTEGGFLNPFLTTFFCLGLVELYRHRSLVLSRWMMGFGLFFLLPGFLSLNMEGLRIIQVLPILLVVAAWGCGPFLSFFSTRGKAWAVILLFLFSAAFDMNRLIQPYEDLDHHPERFQKTAKSLARYRAFLLLKDRMKSEGPGWILGEWDVPADRTLALGTYFFNAVDNPPVDSSQIKWLALLTDAHYRPFLEKRFPQGQWRDLDSDFSKDGNRDLLVIPATEETRPLLTRWVAADKAFRDINWGIDHIHDKDCLEKVNRFITQDYPLIQGDPYLESCFWEKIGRFYYYVQNHFPEHLRASELAVQKGYPAAHLYAQWSELLLLSGNKADAQKALVKEKESEALYPWK